METDIPRLRLSSIEPWDVHSPLIELLKEPGLPAICICLFNLAQLDTLKRMARAINPSKFAKLVENIRSVVPDIALTTDILVGFPGETEKEFQESLDFIQRNGICGRTCF